MIYQPGFSVMNQLVRRASQVTQFGERDIRGPDRHKAVSHVRFAVMALAREKGLSTPQIAKGLGQRDHTTILNGLKRAAELRSDPDFANLLSEMEAD